MAPRITMSATAAPGRRIAYRGAPGRRIAYRCWDQTFHERGGTLTLPHDTQAYMEEHVSSIGSKKAFAKRLETGDCTHATARLEPCNCTS